MLKSELIEMLHRMEQEHLRKMNEAYGSEFEEYHERRAQACREAAFYVSKSGLTPVSLPTPEKKT